MRIELAGGTPAAVLVPLLIHDGQPHVIFTRRREDMRRHGGEISFPGGRVEPADANLLATAIRESGEEIGLRPGAVRPIGGLPPTLTFVTGYAIHPFVAMIERPAAWALSPLEVAEVLELSVHDLRSGYARRRMVRRGVPIRTDTYTVGDSLIWGATARIVADLLDRLERAGL